MSGIAADSLKRRMGMAGALVESAVHHQNQAAAISRASQAQSLGLSPELVAQAGEPYPGSSTSNVNVTQTNPLKTAHVALGFLAPIATLLLGWFLHSLSNPTVPTAPPGNKPAVNVQHLQLLPTTELQ